jgi:lipopolysaccharide transport system ATP-binding protein
MSSPIISIDNLGKKYTLRHQGGGSPYRRFSEDLADLIKRPFRSLRGSASGIGSQKRAIDRPTTDRLSPTAEEFWALRGVSFEVRQGEVLGIIGRNGAGKSTLLKILSRITDPTTGRVRLNGRVASLLEVGTGFHPELTGRENVYLNGAVLGMTRAEIRRKFDEIVAFAEVEKFLDTAVKHYSSGMYVRLAFAVAAHLEPEILIVDEVLAVGDSEFQKKCLGKMSEVAGGGRTVLFVSHNMTAVQSLCKSAMRLETGQLVQIGSAAEVVAAYHDRIRKDRAGQGLSLGRDLVLRRFTFLPARVATGGSLSFSLQLIPQKPIRLHEIAILIYSEYGPRVAIIDLRQKHIRDLQLDNHPLTIDGAIAALPLVEGAYHVGLYLRTDDCQDNYLDIASFSVTGYVTDAACIPYPAAHRGLVELAFDARMVETPHQAATV